MMWRWMITMKMNMRWRRIARSLNQRTDIRRVVQQTKEGMIGWIRTFRVSHETEMKIERGLSRIDWCWDHDEALVDETAGDEGTVTKNACEISVTNLKRTPIRYLNTYPYVEEFFPWPQHFEELQTSFKFLIHFKTCWKTDFRTA